jgi:LysM repeat protein
VLIGAVGGVVVVLLLLGNAFGMLGHLPRSTPSPTPSPTASPSAAATPSSVASATAPPPTISPTLVPTAAPTPTPAPTQRTYRVQANDTLNGIAQKFHTTAQAIADANGIKVTDTINVGQVLIIP